MIARVVFLSAVMLGGCTTLSVESLKSANDTTQITLEENRLWMQADEFDEALYKSGRIYADQEATRYLQSVMDRVYPEFRGTITVKIVKSPHLNAFALPNGSIYFHLGLLARLENEAQLATVLAHEGAHFIHKHGFKQHETVKNSAAFAVVVGAIGIPFLGDVLALSSIYGYSQDLEREADWVGYEHLVDAGYDPHESHKVFEHLAAEVKALDMNEPFFFSSHPKLTERIDSFKALSARHTGSGRLNKARFIDATRGIKLACLASDLSMNRYQSIILALENETLAKGYPPESHFYLAEAYRRRGNAHDDIMSAEQHYIKAIDQAPRFAPTYRALGIHYMKQKEYDAAKRYFRQYLQLAPDAPDHAYVTQYVEQITREVTTR